MNTKTPILLDYFLILNAIITLKGRCLNNLPLYSLSYVYPHYSFPSWSKHIQWINALLDGFWSQIQMDRKEASLTTVKSPLYILTYWKLLQNVSQRSQTLTWPGGLLETQKCKSSWPIFRICIVIRVCILPIPWMHNLGKSKKFQRKVQRLISEEDPSFSRTHRQYGTLVRTSKVAAPLRACFLFNNCPNLYNWNVKWGFSQGTGWDLMDHSALSAFTADFWNVFDEKRATSSDRRYWWSLLKLGPTGTIHQCYHDFTDLQLCSELTTARQENI